MDFKEYSHVPDFLKMFFQNILGIFLEKHELRLKKKGMILRIFLNLFVVL